MLQRNSTKGSTHCSKNSSFGFQTQSEILMVSPLNRFSLFKIMTSAADFFIPIIWFSFERGLGCGQCGHMQQFWDEFMHLRPCKWWAGQIKVECNGHVMGVRQRRVLTFGWKSPRCGFYPAGCILAAHQHYTTLANTTIANTILANTILANTIPYYTILTHQHQHDHYWPLSYMMVKCSLCVVLVKHGHQGFIGALCAMLKGVCV